MLIWNEWLCPRCPFDGRIVTRVTFFARSVFTWINYWTSRENSNKYRPFHQNKKIHSEIFVLAFPLARQEYRADLAWVNFENKRFGTWVLVLKKYRPESISWVKGLVCFVLKFALPHFSPPLPSGVQISKQNMLWTFDPNIKSTSINFFLS